MIGCFHAVTALFIFLMAALYHIRSIAMYNQKISAKCLNIDMKMVKSRKIIASAVKFT